MYGELIPVGGGDPVPLLKSQLMIGRRENCDIVLRFSNVSSQHCELTIENGYWYVKDLGSRNGIKVNDERCTERVLEPGDRLAVAKHAFEIKYSPTELGASGPPPVREVAKDIMSKSLLERAGLAKSPAKGGPQAKPGREPGEHKRFDILDDSEGQIKDPNKPL